MNPENDHVHQQIPRGTRLLEQITAGVLLLVIVTLGWIVIASYGLTTDRQLVTERELIGVETLLLSALGLVRVVALLNTRKINHGLYGTSLTLSND